MKSFFYEVDHVYVESTPRKKFTHCIWKIQRMSFYVENLHLYNNFFVRVYYLLATFSTKELMLFWPSVVIVIRK